MIYSVFYEVNAGARRWLRVARKPRTSPAARPQDRLSCLYRGATPSIAPGWRLFEEEFPWPPWWSPLSSRSCSQPCSVQRWVSWASSDAAEHLASHAPARIRPGVLLQARLQNSESTRQPNDRNPLEKITSLPNLPGRHSICAPAAPATPI